MGPSSRSDKESIFNLTDSSSGIQCSEPEPLYLCNLRFDERHLLVSVLEGSEPSTAEMEINREDYSITCGGEDFNGDVSRLANEGHVAQFYFISRRV